MTRMVTRRIRRDRPPRRPRRCAGMTLLELLLTLAITSMVGAAVAAMLSAVSYGTSSGKDMRSLVVRNKIISTRFTASIRNASMVLESGSGYMVLWLGDSDGSGTPQLGEIQYIEYDTANTRMRSYQADWTGLNEAQIAAVNAEYALDANFKTSTTGVRGQTYFPAEVWMNQVTSWNVTVNNADEQIADLVSFRFGLTNGEQTDELIGAAALRNQ